jgi:hypothetical protein
MRMKMKKFSEEKGLLRLRLLPPIEGAVIGFLLFTFFAALSWASHSQLLMRLVLLPGSTLLTPFEYIILGNGLSQPAFEVLFLQFVISAVPPTIFGAMINSKDEAIRRFGITVLVVYLILLLLPFLCLLEWLIEKPLG